MESIETMNFGAFARKKLNFLAIFVLAAMMAVVLPQVAMAQDVAAESEAADAVAVDDAAADTPGFDHYGPDMIKGQPTPADEDLLASMTFQQQYTDNGEYALWMHDAILMPIITVISLFVLGLLLWVIVRYNKRANAVPSKTSHNTLIEVIWTVIPVLILVVIAVPSITLIARQYQSPPEDAITIKANGYQWYWGYEYVDNGGFEVVSNMLDADAALAAGEPHQLAVDNRMVVPVGVPIRIQTFGVDVIHAFGVPSLWFKIDAVPGRINERMLTIEEPGIYYGQCMELCGARHGYMPIAIEARPLDEYNAWVQMQPGGMIAGQDDASAAEEDAQSAEDAAEAGDVEAVEEAEAAAEAA